MTTAIAQLPRIRDLVEEYQKKTNGAPELLEAFNACVAHVEAESRVNGGYGGNVFGRSPYLSVSEIRDSLRKSAWREAYKLTKIERFAPAADRKKIEMRLERPDEFTIDNIRDLFGDYLVAPREHMLRGLAEVFRALDPFYKSHSNVRVGVDKLPKRMIIGCCGGYSSWGKERFRDLLNALAAYQERPLFTWEEERHVFAILDKYGEFDWTKGFVFENKHYGIRGIKLKLYQNGNLHVQFTRDTLLDVNRALNEYFGEVLPDQDIKPDYPRNTATPSKDLAYYPTPYSVVKQLLPKIKFKPELKILEPSCGCGRILEGLRAIGLNNVTGVEIFPNRVEEARQKGFSVHQANFLETAADPSFDLVIMNPPFAGQHFLKHVRHALGFLKEGGQLLAILPNSAKEHLHDLDGRFFPLAKGSFRESGTNVETVVFEYFR